jgi:uncharacterized SAM-binding protein YcdF (DUF218 family)
MKKESLSQIQELVNYLAQRDEIIPLDLDWIVILGANNLINVEIGVRFFSACIDAQYFPKIILSGGIGWSTPILNENFAEFCTINQMRQEYKNIFRNYAVETKQYGIILPEARIYHFYLHYLMRDSLTSDRLQKDVFIDDQSTNTGENIQNSLLIIQTQNLYYRNAKLLLIESPFLQLRANQVLLKECEVFDFQFQIYNYAAERPQVENDIDYCMEMIKREFFRLQPEVYGSKGQYFIKDVEIPENIQQIYNQFVKGN